MNSDFRISTAFFQHRKTIKLKRRLGADAVLSLLQMWSYVAINHPTGRLGEMDCEDLAIAAGWEGNEEEFCQHLYDIGWLSRDEETGEVFIPDWAEHNPWAAGAVERQDKGRMMALKRHHPDIHKALKKKGVKGVSADEYQRLTTPVAQSGAAASSAASSAASTSDPLGKQCSNSNTNSNSNSKPKPERETTVSLSDQSDEPTPGLVEVVNRWNMKLAENGSNIPSVKKITPSSTRGKLIKARLKEYGWDDVCAAIENAAKSDFLNGRSSKPWTGASIEWVFKPNNFPKVLEGNYNRGDGGGASPSSPAPDGKRTSEDYEALRERLKAKGRGHA